MKLEPINDRVWLAADRFVAATNEEEVLEQYRASRFVDVDAIPLNDLVRHADRELTRPEALTAEIQQMPGEIDMAGPDD